MIKIENYNLENRKEIYNLFQNSYLYSRIYYNVLNFSKNGGKGKIKYLGRRERMGTLHPQLEMYYVLGTNITINNKENNPIKITFDNEVITEKRKNETISLMEKVLNAKIIRKPVK